MTTPAFLIKVSCKNRKLQTTAKSLDAIGQRFGISSTRAVACDLVCSRSVRRASVSERCRREIQLGVHAQADAPPKDGRMTYRGNGTSRHCPIRGDGSSSSRGSHEAFRRILCCSYSRKTMPVGSRLWEASPQSGSLRSTRKTVQRCPWSALELRG